MSTLRTLFAVTLIVLTTGCASGLNSAQQSELAMLRAKNLAVEVKQPVLGAGLGLLPGGGSFYGRAYGWGVVNLLLWPASILWDPVSGYDAAETLNYHASREHVANLRKRDINELDSKLTTNEIDLKAYTLEKRKIEDKYQ
ncbi:MULTISPECIES: hypothetical protein [Pseudomonas]|uniref:hypothetical protein n=1 Tax=Pseudomonas TaxID=286 RepID=UPI00257F3C34|nr:MULTISPECIES: hypothetical protein [Pseudomonas]